MAVQHAVVVFDSLRARMTRVEVKRGAGRHLRKPQGTNQTVDVQRPGKKAGWSGSE